MSKLLFVVYLLFVMTLARASTPLQQARMMKDDVLEDRLFLRSEKALNTLMNVAIAELAKKDQAESQKLKYEWETKYREMYFIYETDRDIGDHYPLNQWLAEKYELLEFVLGIELMRLTRLIDLKTFLYCPQIVFRPCSFDMDSVQGERIDEYRNHFSYGEKYTGLVPVTTYWVTYGAVTAGSSGVFVFFAGIISAAAERIMFLVSPRLSDKVYNMFCEG